MHGVIKTNMQFVSEKIIDQVVAELEAKDNYAKDLEVLQEEQPIVSAYVVSENFDVLTIPEKEYLLYLALVIVKAAQVVNPDLETITEKELGEAEEKNYEIFQSSKERNFRDKLNVFFEDTPQEDLLAFAEDAVAIDEDAEPDTFQVTKEGRDPIFVALKSIIDVLQ